MQHHPGTAAARKDGVQAIPLGTVDDMRARIRKKSKLKGRQPEGDAMAQVRELIGEKPDGGYPRDLLIEYLHKVNDAHRGLYEQHLVALAALMNIPMAEVYEVA